MDGWPATTDTATPSGPPVPPNATADNTVGFANLTERQRAAFLDARDGWVSLGPDSPYLDVYSFGVYRNGFEGFEYVRCEGCYYRIRHDDYGRAYSTHSYELVPATPVSNDSVVDFRNLSDLAKEKVRTALNSGRYTSPFGTSPGVFQRPYIRYENRTYRPERAAVHDGFGERLRVVEYDRNDSGSC